MPSPRRTPRSANSLVEAEERLTRSMNALRIDMLTMHCWMFTVRRSFWQGVAYGIGFVVAVAVLVPVFVWTLRSVNWPPIIAGFVDEIVEQMERQ